MKKKTTNNTFNAEDFSSRKLLDLVDEAPSSGRHALGRDAIQAVISELASRRHYLQELRDRGLLAPRSSRLGTSHFQGDRPAKNSGDCSLSG